MAATAAADPGVGGMSTRGAAEFARIKRRYPLWTLWRDADQLAAVQGATVLHAASLGELEARLADYEHLRGLPNALTREFPDWQIDVGVAGTGIWSAYWCSPDGRSRRYLVTRSRRELLTRLRAIYEPPVIRSVLDDHL